MAVRSWTRNKKAFIFAALVVAAALFLLIRLRRVLAPFLLGLIIAYLLSPAVEKLCQRGVRQGAAILVVYLYAAVALALAAVLCVPVFVEQCLELLALLPGFSQQLAHRAQEVSALLRAGSLPPFLGQVLDSLSQRLQESMSSFLGGITVQLPRLLGWLLNTVLGPILAFYLIRDRRRLRQRLWAAVAPEQLPEWQRLAGDVNHLVRQFVNGYLVVSLIMAALSALFYYAIGLEYSLVLGVVMGIADLIPYFGPFLGAVPALVVAAGEGTAAFIITGLGILVLQQLEGSVITPKIMGDRIGMHPVTTILAVLAGGSLLGIAGAILAVPLTAAISLLLRYIYGRLVGVDSRSLTDLRRNTAL